MQVVVNSDYMDEKTLRTLEFPKVIEKLAEFAAFSASAELARALLPAPTLEEVLERQARTSEASKLLSIKADVSVGGAHDIRPMVTSGQPWRCAHRV